MKNAHRTGRRAASQRPIRAKETPTERSLRRSAAARQLATESSKAGPSKPRSKRSAYDRAVRAASLSAAGVLAIAFAWDAPHPAPAPTYLTIAPIAQLAPAPDDEIAAPFGMHRPQLASVRTDDAFTVSSAMAPRRFELFGERAAAPAPAPSHDAIYSPLASVITSGDPVLFEIIQHAEFIRESEPAPGMTVDHSPRPRIRPSTTVEVYANPRTAEEVCGFGAVVQRGSVTFHRPPTCI